MALEGRDGWGEFDSIADASMHVDFVVAEPSWLPAKFRLEGCRALSPSAIVQYYVADPGAHASFQLLVSPEDAGWGALPGWTDSSSDGVVVRRVQHEGDVCQAFTRRLDLDLFVFGEFDADLEDVLRAIDSLRPVELT